MNTLTFCIQALKVLVCRCINPLRTRNPITGILANIEDPDEMLQTALFAKTKTIFRERNLIYYIY